MISVPRPARALAVGLSLALLAVAVPPDARAQDDPNAAAGFQPLTVEPPLVEPVSGRHGGTLRLSELGELASFNDLVDDSASGADLATLVFDGLVTFDYDKWETGPSLAHRWEASDDHLTYTFHLRRGVKFSDGQPFDADDVVFSFAAVFHPKIANSARSLFEVGDAGLPTLEKVDDHTVRFRLTTPNVMFLSAVGSVKIYPEHRWGHTLDAEKPSFAEAMSVGAADLRNEVVGTGLFRVVRYKGAESIEYERNPWSWRTDRDGRRLPYVDRVVVKLVKDLTTQTEQYLAGGFDLLNSVQPIDINRFRAAEKDGKFQVHRLGVSLSTAWIVLNLDPKIDAETGLPLVAPHKHKLFNDVRFRRALSHAIDRKNLIKLFLDNKGEPTFGQTSRGNKAWYHDHAKFDFDREAAKRLLADMGLADRDGDGILEDAGGNRVEVELKTNVENDTRVKVIDQIAQDWRAVGVAATTAPENFNQLVSNLQDGRRFDCILLGWGSGVPPDPLMSRNILLSSSRLHCWHPQQEKPVNAWEAENDRLVEVMAAEFDLERRKAIWKQVLEHHATYLPQIYLYSAIQYAATTRRVQNARPSLLRPETYHNIGQLWIDETK